MADCGLTPDLRAKWERLADDTFAEQAKALALLTTFFFTMNRISFFVLTKCGIIKDHNRRNMLAACVPSLIHCISVSFLGYHELCKRGWTLFGFIQYLGGNGVISRGTWLDMAGANQAGTMAVCVLSTAYMLADQVFMYIWCPHEKLFILHHWAVLFYLIPVLLLGTGDIGACLCIFVGECTNPINNLYAISDILVSEGSISPVINRCCAGALALAFFFIRLLYAPLGICGINVKFYLLDTAAAHIWLPIRVVWCLLPIVVVWTSIQFLANLTSDVLTDETTTVARLKREKRNLESEGTAQPKARQKDKAM